MSKLNIYINIAVMGNANSVLDNLLDRINKSGLYDQCNLIHLVVNGDIKEIKSNLLQEKYVIHNDMKDTSRCEFPTLNLIWRHARDEALKILYLHTKGVTRPGLLPVSDWTDYMAYFNINRWKDRVQDLDTFDCSGVNLSGHHANITVDPQTWHLGASPKCYSGNFWWSNSSHIIKLPDPYTWAPTQDYVRWRYMCEMWLCQRSDGKYHCAWHSNANHYTERYPKELYEGHTETNQSLDNIHGATQP